MQSPRSRALFLTAIFSQAGQGQVLFLGPGQLALTNDDLLTHLMFITDDIREL